MYVSTLVVVGLIAYSDLAAGHGAIVAATGDQGGDGTAIGIDASTPRDGTRRRPFQQDTTRFQGDQADACGETLGGGDNDVESGTAAVMAAGSGTLPQVSQGGQVMMTLHQVNADGAGPYTCMVDPTGTGTSFQAMTVTQQVPGNRGRERDGEATDFPLTAQMPAGVTCTGTVAGQTGVCMVRCENPARAGPFGGCVPVQMVQTAGATAGNTVTGVGTQGTAAQNLNTVDTTAQTGANQGTTTNTQENTNIGAVNGGNTNTQPGTQTNANINSGTGTQTQTNDNNQGNTANTDADNDANGGGFLRGLLNGNNRRREVLIHVRRTDSMAKEWRRREVVRRNRGQLI
ncbi:hypothetical protein M501DRAFT_1016003 [Patellaria atrata CBS 101060]|uniref:GEgh 16 protein n=1 Tax=Patellaria atrata CBS 101060 TaxID=1346257 RepID=A0A9P4SCG0_9PEZI|nr:hypothetical protein M501DRAFT_1016003 [Patellaria atrata CBS 101060]